MEPMKKLDTNGTGDPRAIVRGEKYRFTVLTPYLLRMEYSPSGTFEDAPTQVVINRAFPVPAFEKRLEDGLLTVHTQGFELRYRTDRPFERNSLSIRVLAGGYSGGGSREWHYGDPVNDLRGTTRTLDEADGAIPLEHGLVSQEGYAVLDDGESLLITEDGWVKPRAEKETDLYFFAYSYQYRRCLKDFFHLAGRTPVLPRWALGNWWSRYHRYTDEEYRRLIEAFEAERVPLSVAVVDMDWHLVDIDPQYGSGWTGYTWNRALFPDPAAFLQWLHERRLHVTLNVHPADGVRAFEDAYRPMAEALGLDASGGEPIRFEPADRRFMRAYFDVLHHPLEEQGVDFWWIDWQQGNTSGMEGLDPLWALNHDHFMDSGREGRRPFTFSRYAGPGSHRYPVGFSGDTVISWASLQFQPYFTATASNIGYCWWSHDIGGHMHGVHDDELTARWVQFGAFSPILRLHSTSNPFNSKEPWKRSPESRETIDAFMRLRHRLIPYLYTMNRRLAVEGEALIQPMYYQEPVNRACYDVPNEYYFGSEMIVAPITRQVDPETLLAGADAWLPQGKWFDFFNGTRYDGGRMTTLFRPLREMPVLAKAGGIVPLCAWDSPAEQNPEELELQVFPGADGAFTLWEDDGEGDGFAEDRWVATRFELDWAQRRFTVGAAQGNLAAVPAKRRYTVVFRSVRPCEVVLEGADGSQIETDYDAAARSLRVRLPLADVRMPVSVTFPQGLSMAENPLVDQVSALLYRAQISYEQKTQAFNAVDRLGSAAAGSFGAMGLSLPLTQALTELMTAQFEAGEHGA